MTLRNIAIVVGIIVASIVAIVLSMPSGPNPPNEKANPISKGTPTDIRADALPAKTESGGELAKKTTPPSADLKLFLAMMKGEVGPPPERVNVDYEPFLAKHGATAVNLIALFEKTGDRKWLDRALETFPNSPIVLMTALLERKEAPPELRREWVDRLKLAEPENPIAWIIASEMLFKEGRPAEAAAEAAAALERPGLYIYASERIAATSSLIEDQGADPLIAELFGIVSLRMTLLSAAQASSKGLESWKTSEGTSQTEIDEAARIQRGLGRMFQTPEGARTIIGQLVGISIETKGLSSLPSDAQERRKAELEAIKIEIRDLTSVPAEGIVAQDAAVMREYLNRMRTDGELSTRRWLNAQLKK
jgi:hypothetical protein